MLQQFTSKQIMWTAILCLFKREICNFVYTNCRASSLTSTEIRVIKQYEYKTDFNLNL